MLRERQKSILDAVIQEYIKTARPVASRELTGDFGIKCSPATIRNEMLELDEMGYLEQPHTSAGRIPTDRGYRFFVDNLLESFELSDREERILGRIFEMREEDKFVKEFSRTVSSLSKTFTAVGTWKEGLFYESGFAEILEEPEFRDPERIKSFVKFTDFLDEGIRDMIRSDDPCQEKILIGEENPLEDTGEYSMMISTWQHPRGFQGFWTLISPKRTNYSRQKAIIEGIKKIQHGR